MLDGGGDDVLSLPLAQLCGGPDSPVVTLGAAGGKDHLLGQTAQSGGHLPPPLLHPLRRLAAQGVAGRWIAPLLRHGLHSRLSRLRPHGGGGRVVQIMSRHVFPLPYENQGRPKPPVFPIALSFYLLPSGKSTAPPGNFAEKGLKYVFPISKAEASVL